MKRFFRIFAVAILIFALTGSTTFAYRFAIDLDGNAHKWDPGANTSFTILSPSPSIDPSGPGTPGGATWSIMPAVFAPPFGDMVHPDNSTSNEVIGMTGFPDVSGVPYEIWAITDALNTWGAVSGFTNMGEVTDGALIDDDVLSRPDWDKSDWNGNAASNANGGNLGDIRIGAYDMLGTILAHAWQPGTEDDIGMFGNIGGDMHIGANINWVDNVNHGNGEYDFFTTVLHEIGHTLGLDHSNDPSSVMALYTDRKAWQQSQGGGSGAQRTLTTDDINGIQALYGPAQVPEPSTLLLLGSGIAGLYIYRKKRIRK